MPQLETDFIYQQDSAPQRCMAIPEQQIAKQMDWSCKQSRYAAIVLASTWYQQFVDRGCACKGKSPSRSRASEVNVTRIQTAFQCSHTKSTRRASPAYHDNLACFEKSVGNQIVQATAVTESVDLELLIWPTRSPVETIIEFENGLESFTDQLLEVKNLQSRVYLMYAGKGDSEIIFRDAGLLNMTGLNYVWIVTEQALEAANVPIGTLGLKLVNSTSEEDHIKDSIYVLASALREMNQTEVITRAPRDCGDSGHIWETGKTLFECGRMSTDNDPRPGRPRTSTDERTVKLVADALEKDVVFIRNQTLANGSTGYVAFDNNGDRINAEYDIINVQINQTQISVGQYHYSNMEKKMILKLDESAIIWPGGTSEQPHGWMIPTHLKVLTIAEKPFVYVREIQADENCTQDETPCPHFNSTGFVSYCCKGFCMDLLKHLANKINVTYDLALSPDGQFGSYIIKNSSKWTGLIGELVNERADMIVAPLTINPERAEFIEFSKPFKYQGITILEKKPSRSSTLVSFLQPFSNTLWILVMVSVHVVALVLYLLDRFSPFGRFKISSTDTTEEDALNLSSAVWFAWGVLLNSGIGEGTPRSFSARVLGMVWAGFAMIIVASYTANLAAFLVLERPKTKLTGINDARVRTKIMLCFISQ
ncbi:Glutamate [NMDA] receptor subunit 1 [Blattella germanica]|nr:Glutamate [NMDA] receptor subunit 1 [Blattella germanica]